MKGSEVSTEFGDILTCIDSSISPTDIKSTLQSYPPDIFIFHTKFFITPYIAS